ncbi:MAG: NAD(P)H-hydrate dehydratase [Blastocatellia bacterium]|nr:NAD(P)H-hydrate dehydratase [Blastocatellia bacterium]
MRKVLTAEQMREVDRLTTERYGIPSIILMENAAHAVARVITEKLGGSVKGKSILILCGKGNNGGDGAALARILHDDGATVEVNLFGQVEETVGDARQNCEKLKSIASTDSENKGCLYFEETPLMDYWVHTSGFNVGSFDVFVDALFGTGLKRPLDSTFRNLPLVVKDQLRMENGFALDPIYSTLVLSIDIPSGLFSDVSETPEYHIKADLTVTFTAPKAGNILSPASRANGELVVADIGSPHVLVEEQPSQLYFADRSDAAKWLASSRFSVDSYKNKRGHALVFAGSEDYSGAAVLAGNAAMRSGVGLVTLTVPSSIRSEVAARALPDLIVRPFDKGEFEVKADAVLIGCGLDANDAGNEAIFRKIVEERKTPVIVDAGALAFVPTRADKSVGTPLILTPHEGEFLRLIGTDSKEAIKDRVAAVRDYATANNVILVLKGERVLIGAPDGRVVVNPTGNSGLGKAGNGDTLAGILVSFVAQAAKMDIDIFETVVAAVFIAGMAGDVAEKKYGKRVMTASDVRECLVEVFSELENS